MLVMWIPTWVIAGGLPRARADLARESLEVRILRDNRAAVADAAREKRELAEHFANQKRADRMLSEPSK